MAKFDVQEIPSKGTAIVFRGKEYPSASDALLNYILDYEGKQKKYFRRKDKYEKEMLDLFCPKQQTSSFHTSLSASMKLMEKLEHDRLPSPTRSNILNGRPSTGSIDTDIILDAKPIVPPSSFKGKSDSLFAESKSSGGARPKVPGKTSSLQFNTIDHKKSKRFQENGSTSLMPNSEFELSYSRKLPSDTSYHEAALTDDRTMLGQSKLNRSEYSQSKVSAEELLRRPIPGIGCVGGKVDSQGAKGLNPLSSKMNSGDVVLQSQEDLLGSSHIGRLREKISQEMPGWSAHDQYVHDSERLNASLRNSSRNSTKDISQISGLNRSFHESDLNQHEDNGHLGVSHGRDLPYTKAKDHLSLHPKVSTRYNKNPHGSYIDNVAGAESDASASSIITGHMLKGALPPKPGLTKASSTPKRGTQSNNNSKQLRFDLENTKSSLGQGLDVRDLTAIPPHVGIPSSKLGASLDLSLVERPPSDNPDFAFGRRDVVGILKANSPGKNKRSMSRVSFTTDDLLNSDPAGLLQDNLRPRSRSLPRTNPTRPSMLKQSDLERLHNPFNRRTGLDRSRSRHSPRASRQLNLSGASDKELKSVKEAKYKEFLKGLMREIDDSASSVATLGGGMDYSQPPRPDLGLGETEGCGYLDRIQKLLSGMPSVSHYLKSDDDTHDSLTTEAVLEGDRSWERITPFKSPKAVDPSSGDGKPKNMFEEFMDECMAEAQGQQQPTEKSQPGSLEALKNMLFTMQSLSTSQDPLAASPDPVVDTGHQLEHGDEATIEGLEDEPNLPLDDSISKLLSPETKKLLSESYSQQPGGPCLAKAMEHLTKLKDLVDYKTDS